jgi:hypothetical protein
MVAAVRVMLCSQAAVFGAYTLEGQVYVGDVGVFTTKLPNVPVKLYVSKDPTQTAWHLRASTTTDSAGWYGLTVSDSDATEFQYFNIVEENLSGYTSVDALSLGGKRMGPDWIQYTTPPPLSGQTRNGNNFWDKKEGQPGNTPPVAEAGGPYYGAPHCPIMIDGSGSYDPDLTDQIVKWEWTLNGVTISTNPGVVWIPAVSGDYTWHLTVTDTHTLTGSDTAEMHITDTTSQDQWDLGDAPEDRPCNYPTTLANNGARHKIVPGGPWLGDAFSDDPKTGKPDAELDGQPSGNCAGDDVADQDDEQCVKDDDMVTGESGSITVKVGGGGYLDAWIDFNHDGTWQHPDEQIYNGIEKGYLSAGDHKISFKVPANAIARQTYARFRISSQGGLSPQGPADDGEVEDHIVSIDGLDWGDAPEKYPTTRTKNGAANRVHWIALLGPFLGANIDTEVDGQPDADALGDDNNGDDDEDGVKFLTPLIPGQIVQIEMTIRGISPNPLYWRGWIDWNGDGIWEQSPSEQVIDSGPLPIVLKGGTLVGSYTVTVPQTAKLGTTYARFRIQENTIPTPTGISLEYGEVEDYKVYIGDPGTGQPDKDFGDAPTGYPDASHELGGPYLGSVPPDAELASQDSLLADGDDTDATGDDEDGLISINLVKNPNVQSHMSIKMCNGSAASATALAWIDWNADGDWDDQGEYLGLISMSGWKSMTGWWGLALPSVAQPGNTYVRLRVHEGYNVTLSPKGPSGPGEVEDHLVQIKADGTGLSPGGVIFGEKFNDINGNHTRDAGELGLPNWTIWLDTNNDGKPDKTTVTDQSGNFMFNGLAAGSYTVGEVPQAGWTQTYPTGAGTHSVTITQGQSVFQSVDFGNQKTGGPGPGGACDFGDAPDSYKTLYASGGAYHTIVPGFFLGGAIDVEIDGQPTSDATGDDSNVDDEDGVFLLASLTPGQKAPVEIVAQQAGKLDAWIDFDGDGSWSQATDQIFTNQQLTGAPQVNFLNFTVPATAKPNITTFARFRFSSAGGLPSYGPAQDGEVEDYTVKIGGGGPAGGYDFGDAPAPYPTLKANNGAYHLIDPAIRFGDGIDAETDGQPDNGALGDDQGPPVDDEDGVFFKTPLTPGQQATIEVIAATGAAGTGKLDAWIDFGVDGSWSQTTDQVLKNQPVTTGLNSLTFTVPVSASTGTWTFARLRISSQGGLSFTSGPAPDGEVQDYRIWLGKEGPAGPPGGQQEQDHITWSQPPIETDPRVDRPVVYCGWDEPAFWGRAVGEQQPTWKMVADDFRCIGSMPVTRIRWWGSYKDWTGVEPPSIAPAGWLICFWRDTPAGVDAAFSHPASIIHQFDVPAGKVQVRHIGFDQDPRGQADTPPLSGLVSHWKLDGDATDSAGANHGTVWGNPVWVSGKVNGALKFDGSGDYVDCGSGASLNITGGVTITGWIKLSALGRDQKIAGNQNGFTGGYKLGLFSNNKIEFEIRTSSNASYFNRDVAGGVVMGMDVWYFVAGVYSQSAGYIRTYVNGALDREVATTAVLGASTGPLRIGCEPYSTGQCNFNGIMDDIRIYSRALSEAEILSLYAPPQSAQESCFEFSQVLSPEQWFWQDESQTGRHIFWMGITALYPGNVEVPNPWGWKTRQRSWSDDAVRFTLTGGPGAEPTPALVLDPKTITPLVSQALCQQAESHDMAFDLRTEHRWVKWDQPFTSLRDWLHYEAQLSMATEGVRGMSLTRQVSDDWLCASRTPIVAISWHGSYLGYGYEACLCNKNIQPRRPDSFMLTISANAPADTLVPFAHPGQVLWRFNALDYDEVLVGFDKHPEPEPNEPVFRYSVRLPKDRWFWQQGPDQVLWFSVTAVYKEPTTNLPYRWGWTNHPHTFENCALAEQPGSGVPLIRQQLRDQTDAPIDMSFTLYTCPMVDFEDFAQFTDSWLSANPDWDLNRDSDIDFKDLHWFTEFWLNCCGPGWPLQ